ncbi:alpha/beta hydrolase [Sphingobium lactosutens]|uniref:alpha/beta hydrolase n=1 Tax=Sphingobium lactosutens TaxID=522773 RepID=UPI0015BD543A|nr:alpha/beta hydrolase [Sphingobium lactosutens]
MYIDPAARSFLAELENSSEPAPETIAEQRVAFSALWRSMAPPAPDVHEIVTLTIPVESGSIDCLVYRPRASSAALPAVIFFHGGGGITLSPEDFDATSRMLALDADCVVIVPRYRQAPEHPFPTPLEDCSATHSWVGAHAGEFGIDPDRIAVAGDSAGGYLAAAVCQEAKRHRQRGPLAQILLYPMLDMAGAAPSRFDRAYFVTEEALKRTVDLHFGDAVLDPRASPLREPDLTALPPALLITTDLDPLVDEGRAYAHRLRAAGIPVSYFCYEGQVHGFFSFGGRMEEGNRCVAHVASYLRHAFDRFLPAR